MIKWKNQLMKPRKKAKKEKRKTISLKWNKLEHNLRLHCAPCSVPFQRHLFFLEKGTVDSDMWGYNRSWWVNGSRASKFYMTLANVWNLNGPVHVSLKHLMEKQEISVECPNHTWFQSLLNLNSLKFKGQSPELTIPSVKVLLTLGNHFWSTGSCRNKLPATQIWRLNAPQ